jgi:AraC family transcriptional activator of pobA
MVRGSIDTGRGGRAARTAPGIPAFALYGEAGAPGQELLHIEEIASRSSLYHWEIEPHVHHGLYQVVWVHAGGAEVRLDERRERLEGPLAVVIPPGIVHGFRFARDTQGWVMTLSARFLVEADFQSVGAAVRELFAGPRAVGFAIDESAAQRICALLRELAAEFAAPGPADAPVATWLARAVVWRLAQACAQKPSQQGVRAGRHQALFTRFVLLVEEHFLEHWPVARYAARLGLSTARLNRLVRAENGRTALAVVHERLVREASRRLVYVAAPVTSLAQELGFDDPAYFCRFFKRCTGSAPLAFRQSHRQA